MIVRPLYKRSISTKPDVFILFLSTGKGQKKGKGETGMVCSSLETKSNHPAPFPHVLLSGGRRRDLVTRWGDDRAKMSDPFFFFVTSTSVFASRMVIVTLILFSLAVFDTIQVT